MRTTSPSNELSSIRQGIDAVDEAIACLLASRVCLSRHAQTIKAEAGMPLRDPSREVEIQHRYELRWAGASTVASAILNLCRED